MTREEFNILNNLYEASIGIDSLSLLVVDYNEVSAYGHFGKKGLPWEQ